MSDGANDEGDDVRDVTGFSVGGVLDAGNTADGRLVLVLKVDDGPLALSMDPKDAEHATAVFLAQLPPTGGGIDVVAESTLSGDAVDVTDATVAPPEAARDAGGTDDAPFELTLARGAGEPVRLRMSSRTALHFCRDLSRQLAAHMRRRSAGAG